jgi:hypothetical protein
MTSAEVEGVVPVNVNTVSFRDQNTQTLPSADSQLWSIEKFTDSACHLYTGLQTVSKFYMVLCTLGPARFHLQYCYGTTPSLNVPDQFLLTLIKLRIHPSNAELAINFDISEKSVSNIFVA